MKELFRGHYFYKRFHEKKKDFFLEIVGNNKSNSNGYNDRQGSCLLIPLNEKEKAVYHLYQ